MGGRQLTRPLAVGLTGGIGSGKSTAADMFASLGVPVIDADVIVHELTRPGGRAFDAVAGLFGPDAVSEQGELRRDRMRAAVFRDPPLRRRLEEILHPMVYDEIRRWMQSVTHPYCIVVIPLLVESGKKVEVDRVLVIDADEDLQVERTRRRDGASEPEVRRIMETQASRGARLAAADDVIVNDGDLEALRSRVMELDRRYLELAADPVAAHSRVLQNPRDS
jgi:dephospho-CoA kinase